jgi:nitrogen fixation NifU-like protein
MYNDKVMEIFQNPKNVGELKGANGIGTVGNESCGDIMKLYLKINDKEIIENATFKTFGCAAAIVSSSVATEMIKGKSIDDALKLENEAIIEYLGGLPDNKIHCSILAKEAIEEAIKDYRKKEAKKARKNSKKA